jgi:uncharacterized protein
MKIAPQTSSTIDTRFRLVHQPIAWDIAIVVLMCAGLSAAGLALITQSIVIDVLGFFGFFGFLMVFWGSFMEPRLITVNKKSIQIKGLNDLTIAVIGDPHVGPYKRAGYVRRIVDRVHVLKPDLILLAGDFVYDHDADITHLEPLKNLQAPLGVFAVLGNHDTGHMLDRTGNQFIPYRTPDRSSDVIALFKKLHIPLLHHDVLPLEHRGQRFTLVGSDHRWMDTYDIDGLMKRVDETLPTILLTHIPDVIEDAASLKADLIVCGHTHGGQIRLPFIGALHPIPDELGRSYDQGIFTLKNGTQLAITHGIGETMARARLFCPPEILVLEVI